MALGLFITGIIFWYPIIFGMAFTDLAYLQKKNLIDDRLKFQRRKTSKAYDILITDQFRILLAPYLEGQENEDYIFSVITKLNAEIQYNQITELGVVTIED